MMSPKPLTVEDAKKGAKATKLSMRAWIRFKKKELQAEKEGQTLGVVKAAIQSPVLAGTIAYIGVSALQAALVATHEAKVKASASTGGGPTGASLTTKPADFLGDFEKSFLTTFLGSIPVAGGVIQGLDIFTGGAVGSIAASTVNAAGGGVASALGLLGNADFQALKIVILIYIASGGNLAGLLGASGGILGDVLKSAGVAAVAGA